MKQTLLWALVAFYLLTGLYLAITPISFYETAPGVSDTGPYNMHFIRDVGFAFIVSALGIAFGLRRKLKVLIVFGSAWLVAHGLFHLVLWFQHSNHTSATALTDLAIVVLPAGVLAYLAATYRLEPNAESNQGSR